MSIKFHQGFWTVVVGDKPVLACVSFDSALEWLQTCSF